MSVLLPPLAVRDGKDEFVKPVARQDDRSVLKDMHKQGANAIVLRNREPVWWPETGSYVLNFNGRVSFSSVKNFQLVHPRDRTASGFVLNRLEHYVVESFGRIGRDQFSLDFTYPLTFATAFAIAMTTFEEGFY